MLRRLGYAARIVYLIAVRDDDHLLAPFRSGNCWGAIGKSNFSSLRFREPVYRSLRELVLSYFEGYFNIRSERSLRAYTLPLNLARFDALNWMTHDDNLEVVGSSLDDVRAVKILTPSQIRRLTHVDRLSYDAAMLGANPAGLYNPDNE